MGALGGRLMQFGKTAALGFGVAAGAAVIWGTKTAVQMENAQVGFTTMLGSAKKATDFLQKLQQFAIVTPFSSQDVIKYSQSMMAMGFKAKEVIPTLQDAGDAVAALGGEPERLQRVLLALGQIKAKGRVMGQEMLQLTENGVRGWQYLADYLHKSVPETMKLGEKGLISADTAMKALRKGMHKDFGGMMKEQANSVSGMWSTLKDTAQIALGKMMTAFFPLIKQVLPKITTGVQGLASVMVPAFQHAGSVIGPLADKIRGVFGGTVMPVMRRVSDYVSGTLMPKMRENIAQLMPVIMRLVGIFRADVLPALMMVGRAVIPVFKQIVAVIQGVIIPAVISLISTIMPQISRFAGFIKGTVAPLLVWAFKQAQPVITQFGQVFATVAQAIGAAINFLGPILAILWKFLGPIVIDTLKGLWSGIIGVISGTLTIIQGIANVFIGIFTGNWSKAWLGVKQILVGVWNFIVGAIKVWIYGSLLSAVRGGVLRIATFWRAGWSGIRSVFTGIISFIRGGVSTWSSAISGIIGRGMSLIRGLWSRGWSGLRTTVSSMTSRIATVARSIPGKITTAFRSLPGKLVQIGKDIIAGLVRGIKNSLGTVLGAAKSIVDHIPGPIRHAMGIKSPSRVMADIGKWIVRGLVVGMLGGSKSVEKTSNKLHDLVTKAFRAGGISKARASSLQKYISKENRKLMTLAKDREKVAAKLKSAQTKLADLQKAKSDMASSVSSKAREFGAFTNAFSTDDGADNSPSAILSRLRGRLNAIVKFRQNLATLHKRGFGNGIINEIAQAGPEQGGPMAAALLNSSGADVKAINSVYAQIGKQSDALGAKVAGDYYNSGIHAAQGLVNGLKSKESALTKAIENLAKKMVKTLRKELGIHSPSRVFRTQGVWVGRGLALGVDDTAEDVQAAVNRLAATRPANRLARSAVEAASVSGGRAASQPIVHVHVAGNVTAEQNLAKAIAGAVRDEIVRTGKRNGGRTGL
jgi:tape measure domain-containing protein